MAKPTSDDIYMVNDYYARREGRDADSRAQEALNQHYTGDSTPSKQVIGKVGGSTVRGAAKSQPAMSPAKTIDSDGWLKHIEPVFLIGGIAEFTIRNDNDGRTRTFRVRQWQKPDSLSYIVDFQDPNTNEWHFVGFFNPEAIRDVNLLWVSPKSRFGVNDEVPKIFRRHVGRMMYGHELDRGYSIKTNGKCPKCGRRLVKPESLVCGMGARCKRRLYDVWRDLA